LAWAPGLYETYGGARQQPIVDLLKHVTLAHPRDIIDLGCGTGAAVPLFNKRWPGALITAIDSSPQMLEKAIMRHQKPRFIEADIATWQPATVPDLIFSNAALHWLDDHHVLFPRLFSYLEPGGQLAISMPANFGAPSHTVMFESAATGVWAARLEDHLRPRPVANMDDYQKWLSPLAADLDIFEKTYCHRLAGVDGVLDWLMGSTLGALIARLSDNEARDWLDVLRPRLNKAYPIKDGITLFEFRRIFIVATRR
jgi:trans-aconitate 2-methyltransferase